VEHHGHAAVVGLGDIEQRDLLEQQPGPQRDVALPGQAGGLVPPGR